MRTSVLLLFVVALLLGVAPARAQTGKIAGTVTDARTGQPLPGVNVVIEGTTQGTTTDVNGFYTIVNVRPGTYDVRASFIGFTPVVRQDVQVNIDLTAEVNFELQEETVGLEEVVVSAEQEVVKRDLSASRVDITADQIQNLPVTDVNRVVGLQAGVQGLNIRGSGADQAAFIMDGFNLGTRRDNTPYTNISYAGVEQIQIQSGGFTAKYGDMRSGIVNVVNQEGPRDRYTINLTASYSPATEKYFGISPSDPNSYWMRPYTDPDVAFVGTENGTWDEMMQQQYPFFQGYNSLAANLASDEDPTNDLTPEQIQALFLWEHRRDLTAQKPDYVIDGGLGGPVPLISRYLGDLRFFTTYRQAEDQYIIPLPTDGRKEWNYNLKLTSNITPAMKVVFNGMWANSFGTSTEDRGGTTRIIGTENTVQDGTGSTFRYNRPEDWMFGTGARSISDIDTKMYGVSFTHTLSPTTFYEVKLQRTQENYFTRPPRTRDETCLTQLSDPALNSILQPAINNGFCIDESPFGWKYEGATSFINNMRMGGHWAEFRDTSEVVQYQMRFDYTSQVNRTNLIQAGVEFSVTPQDINFGFVDQLINPDDIYSSWNETEYYAAIYVQDKLEFQGMIANLGLRLDYMDPNTEWYVIDDPYSDAFLGKNIDEFDEMLGGKKPVDPQIRLSPRLGVSFPVTAASKLYFNYGHAYQRPKPQELYRLSRAYTNDGVFHMPNPRNPMQLTIQYEAGYEQSFLDQFLVRIAGYYKDVRNQPRQVAYISRDGLVNYTVPVADSYADTRGVEISLFKNRGDWVRGFLNYSYMVDSGGAFGFPSFRENRVEQRRYEENTTDYYQNKPLPRPYARFNLEFISPVDFGPEAGGFHPFGDWRLSFLGEWKKGEYFTFTGGQTTVRGIENNMYWKAYRNVDLRISKNLDIPQGNLQLYADIRNVFNIKNFNASAFSDGQDFNSYINSLRLPKEMVEGWEEFYAQQDENGNPIYGNDIPGTLDKDYINDPNYSSFWYLFPRRVFFGMRLSL
ncbi:hypothetical protein AWN76_017290 [Rhodothermaceae bacterium RA]|nr:hypothetical protein AWN76_017290 [Rhodothermaceae bacterium RA]